LINFDPNWFEHTYGWNTERMLVYSDFDLRTLVPNVIESWEVSDDGKTYTLHLHEGMKWSDGVPVTTEDVAFWWFDYINNEKLGYLRWWWLVGGEPAVLEVLDDFSFKFTFAGPFGSFPAQMTRWFGSYKPILMPKHYMKQFHADYTDEAELNKMAAEVELEGWDALFDSKYDYGITGWYGGGNAMEYPSLAPWIIVQNPQEGLHIWERNPYYWKVDQSGNQLPYIDNLRNDYVTTNELVIQKIIQGELDYAGPHTVSMAYYPLYKENEPGNTYIVGDYLSCMTDRYFLVPQHTLPEEPVLQEIIRHPNFVKALSVAIDREEINESLFFGLARMGQMCPMPNSKYFKEKYATAWAQYDPALANQMLDEMGLDERDGDGFRLRPDGERLKFNIEHPGARVGTSVAEFTEMVVSHWRAVGIDSTTKEIDSSLFDDRMEGGLVHCGIWHNDEVTDLLFPIEMDWYLPLDDGGRAGNILWALWLGSDGEEGEEPPKEIQNMVENFYRMQEVADEDERLALGQEILDYLAENPLQIGSVVESPSPLIFNKNMRNLPRPKVPMGWDTYGISTYHPEAFFYKGGKRA